MALWNYTATSPNDVFVGVNTLTEGLFGVSILLLIWLVIFFKLREHSTYDAMTAATFVASIAGLFMRLLNWVNDGVFGIAVVAFIGAIVLLVYRQ